MFSSDIWISTGDGHTVIDENSKRMNFSKSIKIGDHVWIGYKAFINKGVEIPSNSIVGIGSVVNRGWRKQGGDNEAEIGEGYIIAGNPAMILKSGISWIRKRI